MIKPVENLLNLINQIEDVYHQIDEYNCRNFSWKSWADLVEKELSKKSFSEYEKIKLRNAIETLKFIEQKII